MKLQLVTLFEDGSSGITEIERPAGALPDSILVIAEGLLAAEKSGIKVSKIGLAKINPFSSPQTKLVIEDNLVSRDQALKTLQQAMRPMKDRYRPLYH
ncbi:MAG TPA: hypothetical protein VK675_01775 [Candidatus Paceibacterota bacterium]|nr:hypothetical protein [Candidatus Paceibacterota bacterium]